MVLRRSLLLLTVLATVATACAPSAATDAQPTATQDAGAVNDAMAAVTAARQTVEQRVAATVLAVGKVPSMAQALRSPSGVDDALESVPSIAGSIRATDPTALAAEIDVLDAALVDAIGAIDATLPGFGATSWEGRYLTAQREVLAALGAWAGSTRGLVTTLDAHWDDVSRVVERAAVLDEDRWRYRTPEEAAATWEVENGAEVSRLDAVTEAIAPLVAARDAAAEAVTTADRQAAVVFEDRPVTP